MSRYTMTTTCMKSCELFIKNSHFWQWKPLNFLFSKFNFSFLASDILPAKKKDDLHPFSPEDYTHDSSSLEGWKFGCCWVQRCKITFLLQKEVPFLLNFGLLTLIWPRSQSGDHIVGQLSMTLYLSFFFKKL
jgi:hypothetical protein